MLHKFLYQGRNFITHYFSASSSESGIISPSFMQLIIFCLMLIFSVFISLNNFNQYQIGHYNDDSQYIVLAQSILFSDKFGLINAPGEVLPTQLPFGFPLLISPFLFIFLNNWEMIKLVSLILTLINAVLLFWGWPHLSQNKSYWWGLLVASLYVISPLAIKFTRTVLSEPAFLTFILLGLIICEKNLTKTQRKPLAEILLGFVAFSAYFIRSVGVTLIFAIILRIMMLQINNILKIKRLILFTTSGVIFSLIIVVLSPIRLTNLFPHEYFPQFSYFLDVDKSIYEGSIWQIFLNRIFIYVGQYFRQAVFPFGGGYKEIEFGNRIGIPNLILVTGAVFGILIILGHFAVIKNRGLAPSVIIFELLYLCLIVSWWGIDLRFLYPIQPFLIYSFLYGIIMVVGKISQFLFVSTKAKVNFPKFVLALSVASLFGISFYKGITDESRSTQFIRDFRVGSIWIKNNSSENAVIMAEQPHTIYLYSQRKTVDFQPDVAEALEFYGIDYILIAPDLRFSYHGLWSYNSNTINVVIPQLEKLLSQGIIDLVYQSDADLVKIYKVKEKETNIDDVDQAISFRLHNCFKTLKVF